MKRVALLLSLLLAGCRTLTYQSPEGRTINYMVFGMNTKIGKLTAITPEGQVTIENLDTEAQGMELASQALSKIK